MKESPGILALQLVSLALCAWGLVVILEIAALFVATLLGHGAGAAEGPSLPIFAAVWAALTTQLVRGLMGGAARRLL